MTLSHLNKQNRLVKVQLFFNKNENFFSFYIVDLRPAFYHLAHYLTNFISDTLIKHKQC